MTGRAYKSDADRITLNITVGRTGCWEWNLCRDGNGYARLQVNRKLLYGHRFAYEAFIGPIPVGLHLDHLCRVRHCVNPQHLEPVTSAVNTHRGVDTIAVRNAAKTHCPKGHPYDETHTRYDSRGCRSCRTCNRERCAAWNAAYRARRAAAKAAA